MMSSQSCSNFWAQLASFQNLEWPIAFSWGMSDPQISSITAVWSVHWSVFLWRPLGLSVIILCLHDWATPSMPHVEAQRRKVPFTIFLFWIKVLLFPLYVDLNSHFRSLLSARKILLSFFFSSYCCIPKFVLNISETWFPWFLQSQCLPKSPSIPLVYSLLSPFHFLLLFLHPPLLCLPPPPVLLFLFLFFLFLFLLFIILFIFVFHHFL